MIHSVRRRRRILRPALALAAAVMTVSVACAPSEERRAVEGETESHTEGTFYRVPDTLPPGEPGELIRAEDLLGAPDGSRAWRILYHSRDVHGADIAVSGIVVAPIDPGDGDRAVVSWAHPTTGSAPACGPSVGADPFLLIEGVHELLAAGYVVAATDYPGMGADGQTSYLIGSSEGRSVLDAARAARNLDGPGAGSRLLLWGHSQGGQAALFAAQEARSYAPELELGAVAVAAPAAELGELLDDDIVDTSGVTIGAYAFSAFQTVYGPTTPGLELDQILTPAGIAAIPSMVPLCLLTQNKELHAIAGPLVGGFLSANPADVEPWATLLALNTPGGAPVDVPMFVAQGGADTLVKPATTAEYVAHLCATGEHVDSRVYPDMGHGTIAERAIPDVLDMFATVLDGRAPPDTCSSMPPGSTPGNPTTPDTTG
jgi:alpha-beta hydrolase superfamily lysophospholipase